MISTGEASPEDVAEFAQPFGATVRLQDDGAATILDPVKATAGEAGCVAAMVNARCGPSGVMALVQSRRR